jgi:hypothetical protein
MKWEYVYEGGLTHFIPKSRVLHITKQHINQDNQHQKCT